MGKLNEDSYISLGLAITAFAWLAALSFWTGARGNQIETNVKDIQALQSADAVNQDRYTNIMTGITEIKTEIRNLKEKSQKGLK